LFSGPPGRKNFNNQKKNKKTIDPISTAPPVPVRPRPLGGPPFLLVGRRTGAPPGRRPAPKSTLGFAALLPAGTAPKEKAPPRPRSENWAKRPRRWSPRAPVPGFPKETSPPPAPPAGPPPRPPVPPPLGFSRTKFQTEITPSRFLGVIPGQQGPPGLADPVLFRPTFVSKMEGVGP